jgi:hypothetical protein
MRYRHWKPRHLDRLPEPDWDAAVQRVRSEFAEMPGMRLTAEQARTLFGLSNRACEGLLKRLVSDGFLWRTPQGAYLRRGATP